MSGIKSLFIFIGSSTVCVYGDGTAKATVHDAGADSEAN